MRHVKYPSIESLRHIVKDISRKRKPIGFDENNNPVFEKLPRLRFEGTVKLHGTNAGIQMNSKGNIRAAGRNRLLSVESDNYGFAFFVESNKEAVRTMMLNIKVSAALNEDVQKLFPDGKYIVTAHGEWAGKGIQSRVAISEFDKAFYLFGASVTSEKLVKDPETGNDVTPKIWINTKMINVKNEKHNLFNIHDFGSFELTIDFNDPSNIVSEIERLTLQVEERCPVAAFRGVNGIGEGIVWTCTNQNYRGLKFKSKGEKHSKSVRKDPKTNVEIEPEKLNSIRAFVEKTVTESRLQQGISEIFQDKEPDIKQTGKYLDWVMKDVLKEEMDLLVENNLDLQDVKKEVMTEARKWFMKQIAF